MIIRQTKQLPLARLLHLHSFHSIPLRAATFCRALYFATLRLVLDSGPSGKSNRASRRTGHVPEGRGPRGLSRITTNNDPDIYSSSLAMSTSSVSKISVASGGMTPPAPRLPYASSGGITNRRFSPTHISRRPWSQPSMTWPTPSWNLIGLCLVSDESNTVPSSSLPV